MLRSAPLAAVLMVAATHVSATTLSVSDILGTFGAVTQSYSGNSESEGRVIIDGNATGTIRINDRDERPSADGFDDLIITGDATGAQISVGRGGNITVGGNLTNTNLQLNGGVQTVTLGGRRSGGNFNQNEDILIENASRPNIPNVDFNGFAAESRALANRAGPSSITTNASGQRVFGGSSVLNLSFSDLTAGTGVYDLTGLNNGLVINVAGTSGDIALNFVDFNGISKLKSAESVLWNFFEATGIINFNATVFGHVLAPNATINLNSSNEGTIIARSIFSNNGELHPLAYAGSISTEDNVAPAPVPLPAGLWLMLGALSAVGGLRHLRQRA